MSSYIGRKLKDITYTSDRCDVMVLLNDRIWLYTTLHYCVTRFNYTLHNLYLKQCWHRFAISVRLFKVRVGSLRRISCFSVIQRLHLREPQTCGTDCAWMLHLMSHGWFFSWSSWMYAESRVALRNLLLRKLWRWLARRSFTSDSVLPMYSLIGVASSDVMVAL